MITYIILGAIIIAVVALFINLEMGEEFFMEPEEAEMTATIAGAVFTSILIIMLMMGVLIYNVEKEMNANEQITTKQLQ